MVIAYPMLPGDPAWTLGDEEIQWSIDPEAPPPAFLPSLTRFLSALRSLPTVQLEAAGIPVRALTEIRTERRQMIEQTREVLQPPSSMEARWTRWLETEELWPDRAVVAHGDLHPGHLLLAPDGAVQGVLDWSEVHVGDPATDLVFLAGTFGQGALDKVIRGLEAAERPSGMDPTPIGSRSRLQLTDHVMEAWAFNPVPMAAWGLEHDHPGVVESARHQLAEIVRRA